MTRIIGVFTTTVAALTCSTTAAFAMPLPAPGPMRQSHIAPATTIVTHTTSGLAVWAVVLIAVASVAAGSLLTQAFRAMKNHSSTRGLATA
jgi:glycerol uptake facilitator-like aquaporin